MGLFNRTGLDPTTAEWASKLVPAASMVAVGTDDLRGALAAKSRSLAWIRDEKVRYYLALAGVTTGLVVIPPSWSTSRRRSVANLVFKDLQKWDDTQKRLFKWKTDAVEAIMEHWGILQIGPPKSFDELLLSMGFWVAMKAHPHTIAKEEYPAVGELGRTCAGLHDWWKDCPS